MKSIDYTNIKTLISDNVNNKSALLKIRLNEFDLYFDERQKLEELIFRKINALNKKVK